TSTSFSAHAPPLPELYTLSLHDALPILPKGRYTPASAARRTAAGFAGAGSTYTASRQTGPDSGEEGACGRSSVTSARAAFSADLAGTTARRPPNFTIRPWFPLGVGGSGTQTTPIRHLGVQATFLAGRSPVQKILTRCLQPLNSDRRTSDVAQGCAAQQGGQ